MARGAARLIGPRQGHPQMRLISAIMIGSSSRASWTETISALSVIGMLLYVISGISRPSRMTVLTVIMISTTVLCSLRSMTLTTWALAHPSEAVCSSFWKLLVILFSYDVVGSCRPELPAYLPRKRLFHRDQDR